MLSMLASFASGLLVKVVSSVVWLPIVTFGLTAAPAPAPDPNLPPMPPSGLAVIVFEDGSYRVTNEAGIDIAGCFVGAACDYFIPDNEPPAVVITAARYIEHRDFSGNFVYGFVLDGYRPNGHVPVKGDHLCKQGACKTFYR